MILFEDLKNLFQSYGLKTKLVEVINQSNSNHPDKFFDIYEIYIEWKYNIEKIGYGPTIVDAVVCAYQVFKAAHENKEHEEGFLFDVGGVYIENSFNHYGTNKEA